MSDKVRPQVGFKYRTSLNALNDMTQGGVIEISPPDGAMVKVKRPSGAYSYFCEGEILSTCEFIPANDLEWLAVNEVVWVGDSQVLLSKQWNASSYDYRIDFAIQYTKQQWQECRYKLGLDDRPTNEGVKMIDLSNAVVGDKFEAAGDMLKGTIFTLVAKGDEDLVFEENGSHHISDMDGIIVAGVVRIARMHDPLKELPDASVFSEDITHIKSSTTDGWMYSTEPPSDWKPLVCVKMPSITTDFAVTMEELISYQNLIDKVS